MKNKRKLIVSLFLAVIVAGGISCSSNDKKDEGVSPDVAEATSDAGAPADGSDQAPPADGSQAQADNPDAAAAPPADGAQASADQPPADPNAAPDAAALDAPPTPGDAAKAPESSESEMASADQPPADPNSPPPVADAPPAAPDAVAPPAPADESASAAPPADTSASSGADAFGAAAAADSAEPPHKKKAAALAHIKDAPFSKGGQNLNTVYIARDGDTMETISQKLFGDDTHSKDLKKGNPSLKKGVKTGDKVYFNSPNRPDDKEKMMTVYEDQGLPPSVYTTKEGDTLKSLSQEWYGTEGSYKEIYAINKNLTSTKELPAGTELQYWPASASVAVYGAKAPDVAANNAPPPPPPPGNNPPGGPGAPGAPGAAPGAPGAGAPGNMAANNPPPGAAGIVGAPPGAPGAPGSDIGAPPPPPPGGDMMPAQKPHRPVKDLSSPGAMDKDTIFYAGLAGILLISSALWFALRRRRSRNSGVTQI